MPMKKRPDADIRHKYACHKGKAKHRDIPFNLTYEQWWDIWQQSGKWEQRGRGLGQYVMARYNDIGAYEVGNVHIIEASQNKMQGNLGRKNPRTAEWQAKLTTSILKTMRDPNWVNPHKGKSNPQAALNGRKGAKKVSAKRMGSKRVYREDGSWFYQFKDQVNE